MVDGSTIGSTAGGDQVTGTIELLVIAPESGAAVELPQAVEALAGRGLAGDRYCLTEAATGRAAKGNITLIERASFDHLRSLGLGVEEHELRRNVVVSGLDLNQLVGSEFTIGSVRCLATELCEPCRQIERLTHDGVLKALVGRGGIRAEILSGGLISIGDSVAG